MKNRNIVATAVFLCAIATRPLLAQEASEALTVDLLLPAMSPLSRLAGEDSRFVPLNVMYQRVITEHQVLMLKMGVNYNWDTAGQRSVELYPMLALDWHPYDTGLQGFHLGPALFFSYAAYAYSHSASSPASDPDYAYWSAVGGNVGYGFLLRDQKIIDVVFGLGWGYSKEVARNGEITSHYQVDETLGGVFVGYRF